MTFYYSIRTDLSNPISSLENKKDNDTEINSTKGLGSSQGVQGLGTGTSTKGVGLSKSRSHAAASYSKMTASEFEVRKYLFPSQYFFFVLFFN